MKCQCQYTVSTGARVRYSNCEWIMYCTVVLSAPSPSWVHQGCWERKAIKFHRTISCNSRVRAQFRHGGAKRWARGEGVSAVRQKSSRNHCVWKACVRVPYHDLIETLRACLRKHTTQLTSNAHLLEEQELREWHTRLDQSRLEVFLDDHCRTTIRDIVLRWKSHIRSDFCHTKLRLVVRANMTMFSVQRTHVALKMFQIRNI